LSKGSHSKRVLQKLLANFSDWTIFPLGSVEYGAGNVLAHITSPAFGGFESDYPKGMRILAA
jgi:hypothetical protein